MHSGTNRSRSCSQRWCCVGRYSRCCRVYANAPPRTIRFHPAVRQNHRRLTIVAAVASAVLSELNAAADAIKPAAKRNRLQSRSTGFPIGLLPLTWLRPWNASKFLKCRNGRLRTRRSCWFPLLRPKSSSAFGRHNRNHGVSCADFYQFDSEFVLHARFLHTILRILRMFRTQIIAPLSFLVVCILVAGCTSTTPTTDNDVPAGETIVAAVNANCPIMGNPVKDDGGRTEWNGQTIGFC